MLIILQNYLNHEGPAVGCSRPAGDRLFDGVIYHPGTTKFKKLVCAINKGYTHADSETYCQANGMQLFQIDSLDTEIQIYAITVAKLGKNPNSLWVDGVVESKIWYFFAYGKDTAPPNLTFTNSGYANNDTLCISTLGIAATAHYTCEGRIRTNKYWFICEKLTP